ncbi:MAG TPA: hypothetical protein VN282_26195 [Pyrinomonadaceae bacterium]|nr:hypothetical protein [Pyrinomonadaceae bacterium]
MKQDSNTITVIVCVDFEPYNRQISPDGCEEWTGVEETARYFGALRSRLEGVTGAPAHFNWYFRMDPQIERAYGSPGWGARRSRAGAPTSRRISTSSSRTRSPPASGSPRRPKRWRCSCGHVGRLKSGACRGQAVS